MNRLKAYKLFFYGFVVLFLLLTFYQIIFQEPKTASIEEVLLQELNSINQFPQATFIKTTQSHKTDHALVGKSFFTMSDYVQIRSFYDLELPKNGWVFDYEEPIIYDGKDYGGKSVYYKKGEYVFTLEYEGRQPNLDSTFIAYTSWGLHDSNTIPLFIMAFIIGAFGLFLLLSPKTIQEFENERRSKRRLSKLNPFSEFIKSNAYTWILRLVGIFFFLISLIALTAAILQSLKIIRV